MSSEESPNTNSSFFTKWVLLKPAADDSRFTYAESPTDGPYFFLALGSASHGFDLRSRSRVALPVRSRR